MTTYKEIHGKAIKSISSDLSESTDAGQIFYNTTGNVFKSIVTSQAWSSASPLVTARSDCGGFGVRDASVIYGGSTNATEEYNGSGFSAGGNLNTGRPNCQDNGWGVETAAVIAAGYDGSGNTANVEEYNGSSFSEVNNVSTARRQQASIGLVQTAGAICGGYTSTNVNSTEEYDGTNWTSGGNLTTTRRGFAGSGTLTAGIVFSGYTTTVVANTEEYDGTSWTAATAINTARNNGIGASNAPQSTALLFGGNTGSDTGKTEQYNGTSWTEVADMATARDSLAGSGIGTAALAAGGLPPPGNVALAEEFNQSTNTITAAAWASSNNLNTARSGMFTGPIGSQTAGLAVGGEDSSKSNATEEYDGSSWTTVNTIPVSLSYRGGAGTQAAGLVFGGNPNPSTVATTNEYDGTNWTSGGDLNNSRGYGPIASGTQTAALAASGYNPPVTHVPATEYYNGSAWTSQPGIAAPQVYAVASGGTQTATWAVMGISPPSGKSTFEWDGSSWTTGNSYATDRVVNLFGGGPQTQAWMCAGDKDPGFPTSTNHYNGTTWATAPNVGTGRSYGGQAGTQTAGLIFGGTTPSASAATEEFTGETTAANVKTISSS